MDRKHEDYGEWMVMARLKLMNKARGKQSNPDLSQSDESFQEKSDRPLPRKEEQSKAAGKRKATHSQPTVSHREESKASLLNQSKSNDGKSSKGQGSCAKSNQKSKVLVEVNRMEWGRVSQMGLLPLG